MSEMIDWTIRKEWNEDDQVVKYNLEELIERARKLFNSLMYHKFYFCVRHRDDLWQECCLTIMKIYMANSGFNPRCIGAYLYFYCKITILKYLKKERRQDALSLDASFSEDNDNSFYDLLGVYDKYFAPEIDYMIFSDKENALIDKILNGQDWIKDKVYGSLRNKLVDLFNGNFEELKLVKITQKQLDTLAKCREYQQGVWAQKVVEGGEEFLKNACQSSRDRYDTRYNTEKCRNWYRRNREKRAVYQREYYSKRKLKREQLSDNSKEPA